MRLLNLIACLEYALIQTKKPLRELEISGISYDSRDIKPGELFVCIRGYENDGHRFIQEAAEKGALALLVDRLSVDGRQIIFPENTAVILVEDTREALAYIAAEWFGYPAKHLTVIGITGTKGKTTAAWIIKELLQAWGSKCGYIGTLGIDTGKTCTLEKNTTPESFTIHKYFAKMVEAGCKYVVIEVSSQGLKYKRTEGIQFAAAVFTNLGEDHIGPGEHESMEEYRYCKSLLFRQCDIAIGNVDDKEYDYMFREAVGEKYGFGVAACQEKAETLKAKDIRFLMKKGCPVTEFTVRGEAFSTVLPGMFNVYNVLAAIEAVQCLHQDEEFGSVADRIRPVLKRVTVKGRMQRVIAENNIACYIDYSHNAMSLEKALTTLRIYQPRRIITIFGCGGNRAKSRRTQMGEVSGQLSDLTVITSDNPRFEKPEDIMRDIEDGIKKTKGKYLLEQDRKEAVARALQLARPGDIVLVAGKGHENYQEIKGVRYPMDDRTLIENAWKEVRMTECTQTL